MNGKRSWGKYAGASLYKVWDFHRVLWSLEHPPHGFLAQSQGEELRFITNRASGGDGFSTHFICNFCLKMWLYSEAGRILVFPKLSGDRKMQSVLCTSKVTLVLVVPRTLSGIWEWRLHSQGWSHTCLLLCMLHLQEIRAIPNHWVSSCPAWFKFH